MGGSNERVEQGNDGFSKPYRISAGGEDTKLKSDSHDVYSTSVRGRDESRETNIIEWRVSIHMVVNADINNQRALGTCRSGWKSTAGGVSHAVCTPVRE